MFTQAQIEYIQKQYARGLTADAISNKLIEAGWDKDDIDDGIKEVARLSSELPAATSFNDSGSGSTKVTDEIKAASLEKSEGIKFEMAKAEEAKSESVKLEPTQPLVIKTMPNITEQNAVAVDGGIISATPKTSPDNSAPLSDELKGVAAILPNSNKHTSPSRLVKFLLMIILTLLILGGLGFAYYQFFYKPSLGKAIDLIPVATTTDDILGINSTNSLPLPDTLSETEITTSPVSATMDEASQNEGYAPSGQIGNTTSVTLATGTNSAVKNCKLSTGGMVELNTTVGGEFNLSVTGYGGPENKIFWSLSDTKVAKADVLTGKSIKLVASAIGTSKATAVDTSIGNDCQVSIDIKIKN